MHERARAATDEMRGSTSRASGRGTRRRRATRPRATRCWYAPVFRRCRFRRIRHEPGLDQNRRHVGPVEAGQVGTLDDPAVRRPGRSDDRRLQRTAGSQASRVDVVRPAAVPGGHERRDAVQRAVARAVGVDPHHQRRVPPVAEARPRDVAVAVAEMERRAGARHRHPVAAGQQQPARTDSDRQRDRRLARRAAAVLDLPHPRPRPDRLELPADRRRRPVPRVEADERRDRRSRDHDRRSARYFTASG